MDQWLATVAIIYLLTAALCALCILVDILRGHSRQMFIMDMVWPLTALYAGPLALLAYSKIGRLSTRQAMQKVKVHKQSPPAKQKPFWQTVSVGVTHCGSGCTLGDIIAEWGVFLAMPALISLSCAALVFTAWGVDYLVALVIGIAFQYFSIVPMRNLAHREGLVAALKADFLSLSCWQIGMYGWMAIALFVLFGLDNTLMHKTSPVFWFMMQTAMLFRFLTSYPVNWWLIRSGIKEEM